MGFARWSSALIALVALPVAGDGRLANDSGGTAPLPVLAPADRNCFIAFYARNTLAEDVWVIFAESYMFVTPAGPFDRVHFNDIGTVRVPPGRRMEEFTFRRANCDLDREFFIHIRVQTVDVGLGPTPAGPEVVLHRRWGHVGLTLNPNDDRILRVDLGESECWLDLSSLTTTVDDPLTDCQEPEEEEEEEAAAEEAPEPAGPFRVWDVLSGPVCDAGEGEVGRPPSSSICASRDVAVRGEDTCVFDGARKRCTWWGFELEYENAAPGEPLVCIWQRALAVDDGNYEGVAKAGIAVDTVQVDIPSSRGRLFNPGFDTFPERPVPPWLPVPMVWECSYQGRPMFTLDYRLIFSSAFR